MGGGLGNVIIFEGYIVSDNDICRRYQVFEVETWQSYHGGEHFPILRGIEAEG